MRHVQDQPLAGGPRGVSEERLDLGRVGPALTGRGEGADRVAGAAGQPGVADFVALAVQADLTCAGGYREVPGVEAGAPLDSRTGIEQHRDDSGGAGAAAGGRTAERGFLLAGERVGLAGPWRS